MSQDNRLNSSLPDENNSLYWGSRMQMPQQPQQYTSGPSSLGAPMPQQPPQERLVQLARRKRGATRKAKDSTRIKPHGRPMAPEAKVRLTLSPSLAVLYQCLVTDSSRKTLNVLKTQNGNKEGAIMELSTYKTDATSGSYPPLKTETVTVVDQLPEGVKEENLEPGVYTSIYKAVKHMYGLDEFSLLRITRAAASEPEGAVLLKIETVEPGDMHLNDDEADGDHTRHDGIGEVGDPITASFLKKKIARPRYKSNMRIYVLPRRTKAALYTQARMLKRDLLNNVLVPDTDPRLIICAFDYVPLLQELKINVPGEAHQFLQQQHHFTLPPQTMPSPRPRKTAPKPTNGNINNTNSNNHSNNGSGANTASSNGAGVVGNTVSSSNGFGFQYTLPPVYPEMMSNVPTGYGYPRQNYQPQSYGSNFYPMVATQFYSHGQPIPPQTYPNSYANMEYGTDARDASYSSTPHTQQPYPQMPFYSQHTATQTQQPQQATSQSQAQPQQPSQHTPQHTAQQPQRNDWGSFKSSQDGSDSQRYSQYPPQ